jgi:hypothetical protein
MELLGISRTDMRDYFSESTGITAFCDIVWQSPEVVSQWCIDYGANPDKWSPLKSRQNK